MLFFLKSGDHINAFLVASAFKLGGNENIGKLKSNACANGSCAHAKDVGIVMFSGKLSGKMVAAASCADSFEFVCADAHSDSGSANKDSFFTFAGLDSSANFFCINGIIAGSGAVCTEIDIFDTFFIKMFFKLLFIEEAAVVGTKCDHNLPSF